MKIVLLLVLAACGHVVRVSAGPQISSDGRRGAQISAEAGQVIGYPRGSMPVALRLQAGVLDHDPQLVLLAGTAIDFGPGFPRALAGTYGRPGKGMAMRAGASYGVEHLRVEHVASAAARGGDPIVTTDDTRGVARYYLGVGYGSRKPAATCNEYYQWVGGGCMGGPMKLRHAGVELAWTLPIVGLAGESTFPSELSAEVYVEWMTVAEDTNHGSSWAGSNK